MKKFKGTLKSIPPEHFFNGSEDELDNFFLVLSLIYNDIKGIVLFNQLINDNYEKPEVGVNDVHTGEHGGIHTQIYRLSVGYINEFLIFLKKNEKIINSTAFKKMEVKLPSAVRKEWSIILKTAFNPDKKSDSFLSKIARVRSNVVSHYDESRKELRSAFSKFFSTKPKTFANENAYYSIGGTMESTRFYYSDAAVQEYIAEQLKVHDSAENYLLQAIKLMGKMNQVITSLMAIYLSKK